MSLEALQELAEAVRATSDSCTALEHAVAESHEDEQERLDEQSGRLSSLEASFAMQTEQIRSLKEGLLELKRDTREGFARLENILLARFTPAGE